MTVLKSSLATTTPAFKANAAAMAKLVDELKTRQATAALGGDERSRKRHTERGKLLPRERVERLVDPGSPFLELSPLAAFGMYDGCLASIWSTVAARTCPTRPRFSPTASISAASSSTRPTCRPPAFRRSPASWGPAQRAAPMCRQ
jgi:hypothetical protein